MEKENKGNGKGMSRDEKKGFLNPFDQNLQVALYEPRIPQNTGNISRTCVATATPLHIIGETGFSMEDRYLRRAGLDYWDNLNLSIHRNWEDFNRFAKGARIVLFTSHQAESLFDFTFEKGDILLFGNETHGVPENISQGPDILRVTIPQTDQVRCLNLSNSVAVGLYMAIFQLTSRP